MQNNWFSDVPHSQQGEANETATQQTFTHHGWGAGKFYATVWVQFRGGGDDPGVSDDGKIRVIFWQNSFEEYQEKWFSKHVDAFNASQDRITVAWEVVPDDAWDQKLAAAQAAGGTPDVFTVAYNNIKPRQRDRQLLNLSPLMDAAALADIKENVKEFVTVDGGVYGYPLLVEPSTVLFYRTDLFEAAGLSEPPKTWDELIEYARVLTQGDVKGMNIAQTAGDIGWSSWGLQYNIAGDLPLRGDWSKAFADDPAYEKLLELYQTLYTEGLMPQEPTHGYANCGFFGEGSVAMSASGSWCVGNIQEEGADGDWQTVADNFAVAPFPSFDADPTRSTATLGGWTLAVDAKTQVPEAAAEFIGYILGGDTSILTEFFEESSFSKYAARTSVDEALSTNPNPYYSEISEKIVAYAKPEPGYPWDISFAFGEAVEKAMRGGDIKAALAEAQSVMETVIDRQQLAGLGSQ